MNPWVAFGVGVLLTAIIAFILWFPFYAESEPWHRRKWIILLIPFLSGCVASTSPQRVVDSVPTPSLASAMAVIPARVTRHSFAWNYPQPVAVSYFLLCITNVDTLAGEEINVGRTLSYTFSRTNWNEWNQRHWYSVKAVIIDIESIPSNRLPQPWFPPDRMEVTSSVPVLLQWTKDLASWIDLAMTPQTLLMNQPQQFVRGKGNSARLSARYYNPLNE